MKLNIKKLVVKKDDRGWLAEIIRSDDVDSTFGQILITTALPGKTKGNHYHKRKKEWYCVIKGKGLLRLKDLKTDEVKDLILDAEDLKLVEMPLNVAHAIKNVGNQELFLLAYVSESFNLQDPDTYFESIM